MSKNKRSRRTMPRKWKSPGSRIWRRAWSAINSGESPNYGIAEPGVKTECVRIRETRSLVRKGGTSRERAARTDENIERARSATYGNYGATCGEAMEATDRSRPSVHRTLRRDREMEPLRKTKAQRAWPTNEVNRLEIFRRWGSHERTVEMATKKIYCAEEELPRLGARPGGNNKLVVYVRKELRKRQLQNNLILRDDGARRGGVSVMAPPVIRCELTDALRFAQAGTEINSAEYLEVLKNEYLPECHIYYGSPPDYISQKDGSSPNTANVVQGYC